MKKISFYTLGCKLNQAETAVLAEQFSAQGYQIVPFGQQVDLCVINTCTVTAKTDYRCRQMIRKAMKISPDAKIVVVGCYAQLNPEKIEKMAEVDYIFGSDAKFDLLEKLNSQNVSVEPFVLLSDNKSFRNPLPGNFWNHTRAFLKIQDGCDSFCSYCTVPSARGKSRSDSLEHIVATANKLIERGHKEIVLTGVHIGKYGNDLQPRLELLDVLKSLEKIGELQRIRLSSLEPLEIKLPLIEWIVNSKKICSHFHIPLQSGDDGILKLMNRNYTTGQYNQVIEQVKTLLPECGLGADVIVGFPGETDEQFLNSLEFVKAQPFSYLHVFSYSKRPGTRAAQFKNAVNPAVIKQRSERLREIGRHKKADFYQSLIGKKLRVLWEEKLSDQMMVGWSDNYVRVRTRYQPDCLNQVSFVEIVSADADFVVAKMIDSEKRSSNFSKNDTKNF